MPGLSDMVVGHVTPMVRCKCWEFLSDMVVGCVRPMVKCKCWASHSDLGSDISAKEDLHGG